MIELETSRYPQDAIKTGEALDTIDRTTAPTLDALFAERVRRSRERVAYTEYDVIDEQWKDYTWGQMANKVARWQNAFIDEGLIKGDRVAVRLKNGVNWVVFDQAALSLGLVVVPLYTADRADNINYVLADSESSLVLLQTDQEWRELAQDAVKLDCLKRVVCIVAEQDTEDKRVISVSDWLPTQSAELVSGRTHASDLASIVYTSGTTGRPKGVMLSHDNMISNAYNGLQSVVLTPRDVGLSFLPLSHTLERTVGYYLSMNAGSSIVYNRDIPLLIEDLKIIRPTAIISVPRIFERAYGKIMTEVEHGSLVSRWLFNLTRKIGWQRFEYRQGRQAWFPTLLLWPALDMLVARKVRALFGGRLRLAVVGGAPLPLSVSKMFISFEVFLLQGYGLTETSPSLTINTLNENIPSSIGLPLHEVEIKIGENDELLARGPNVMMGYWRNEKATREAINEDGWLHSGDQARIEGGFIWIIGRIKDILVLANGEKVPPADMESAISEDPLFNQTLIIGEHKPFLAALVVLDRKLWAKEAAHLGVTINTKEVIRSKPVEEFILKRIRRHIQDFPGYARIHRVHACVEPWTVENDLMTPTLKLKRNAILKRFKSEIDGLYKGHEIFNDHGNFD